MTQKFQNPRTKKRINAKNQIQMLSKKINLKPETRNP
jgi:hypothetical protein